MAPAATTPTPGRMARAIRRLVSWRRHIVIAVAIEVGLIAVHLPLALHLVLSVALHPVVEVAGQLRKRS